MNRLHDFRLVLPVATAWLVFIPLLEFVELSFIAALAAGIVAVLSLVLVRKHWIFSALATQALLLSVISVSFMLQYQQQLSAISEAEMQHPGRYRVEISGFCKQRTQALVCAARLADTGTLVELRLADALDPPAIGAQLEVTAKATALASDEPERFRLVVSQVNESNPATGLAAWLAMLRAGLLEASENLPGAGGQLLPGLSTGDTRLVPDQLDEQLKITSLSHLTAVSGSNCTMILVAALFFLQRSRVNRVLKSALAGSALAVFILLVTAEPSVIRAGVMAFIGLLAATLGRQGSGLSTLATTVLLLLVVDPWLATQLGFVLSVAATLGLLTIASPISDWLARFLPESLAIALSVPIAAQLACQPFLLILNDGIPLYGVIANVLAAPAVPLATALGLLAAIALVWAGPLGELLLQLAWLPAYWIGALAEFFAELPLAALVWFTGPVGIGLAIALWLLTSVALLAKTTIRKISGTAAATLAIVAAAILLGNQLAAKNLPADWLVAMCDIGQGDAIVVRSDSKYLLIDTGPDPDALHNCLETLGIVRIDLLVLTHFDQDHIGAVSALENTPVDTVLYGRPKPDELDELQRALPASVLVEAKIGQTGQLGKFSWRVLWPRSAQLLAQSKNDTSVVLLFQGPLSMLTLGDLSEKAQQQLVASGGLAKIQVVKVAHHGSADQYAELYKVLQADFALISVGLNSFGHPSDRILEILASSMQHPAKIFRTDLNGLILLGKDHNLKLRYWLER